MNDFQYKYGEKKYILRRINDGGVINPEIYLDRYSNDLFIEIGMDPDNDADADYTTDPSLNNLDNLKSYQIVVKNLPLKQWSVIALRVSLNDKQLSVFRNGEWYTTHTFHMNKIIKGSYISEECDINSPCNDLLKKCIKKDGDKKETYICYDKTTSDCSGPYCWNREDNIRKDEIYSRIELGPQGGFDGLLKNFVIFDSALDPAEIKALSLNASFFTKLDIGSLTDKLKSKIVCPKI